MLDILEKITKVGSKSTMNKTSLKITPILAFDDAREDKDEIVEVKVQDVGHRGEDTRSKVEIDDEHKKREDHSNFHS